MEHLPDHPEIAMAMRTGYPSWSQPIDIKCEHCGDIIEDEVYQDEHYDNLCLDCLLKLHLKECD